MNIKNLKVNVPYDFCIDGCGSFEPNYTGSLIHSSNGTVECYNIDCKNKALCKFWHDETISIDDELATIIIGDETDIDKIYASVKAALSYKRKS